jgi:hypothetical protein
MMTSAEERLAMIGFGREPPESPCWRSVRVGSPAFRARSRENAPDPALSRALARWREVLGRNPRPSPYRIRRVAG